MPVVVVGRMFSLLGSISFCRQLDIVIVVDVVVVVGGFVSGSFKRWLSMKEEAMLFPGTGCLSTVFISAFSMTDAAAITGDER